MKNQASAARFFFGCKDSNQPITASQTRPESMLDAQVSSAFWPAFQGETHYGSNLGCNSGLMQESFCLRPNLASQAGPAEP